MLAYHVTLFAANHYRWEYFVDASNGDIIHYYKNTCGVDGPKTATAKDLNDVTRNLNTYQYGSYYYLIDISKTMFPSGQYNKPDDLSGAIITIDMNNTYGANQEFTYVLTSNNVWNNPTAVSAHYNAGVAYDYYKLKHGRNSIDGNGGSIFSIINVVDDETGGAVDNAYWNGRAMFYGNGDVAFTPLAGGLDVAGHELTHGVIENTANLEYEDEPGAVNESLADVFGTMIENDDWLMGEDVVRTQYYPTGALRSFSDPHNGGSSLADAGYQPMHVNEQFTGSDDNGGVHINSGICNHAFYHFAQVIGKDQAAAIYYKALDDYLTKSSQFIDLRLAVVQAATDLHGAGSEQVTQAKAAFDAVGITDGEGTDVNTSLPENPGEEYLLVYNTDESDENTLYRSNLGLDVLEPLSTTPFYSRPSVTDDGEWAVFVADDSTLHGIITLPGYEPDESVVQDEHMWGNAVLSKDGNKVGAVSAYADATISVYDYNKAVWKDFTLYNPTYLEDVESSGVLYADALEFDYSGEFIVFDAFNSIKNSDGDPIEYWDVNFIRVWDNATDDFGDGKIFKLFTSIPEGVSIGNPTFSKNSTNIVAFDYWDEAKDAYYILGCNIETNEVNTIVENDQLGWPSFKKDDSRIAFTSTYGDNYEINYVNLNADKISSDGTIYNMFTYGAWPIYYSTGERETRIKETSGSLPGLKINSYPNPFTGSITLEIPVELQQKCTLEVLSQTGQIVYAGFYEFIDGGAITLDLKALSAGYYFLRLRNEKSVASGKIIKME